MSSVCGNLIAAVGETLIIQIGRDEYMILEGVYTDNVQVITPAPDLIDVSLSYDEHYSQYRYNGIYYDQKVVMEFQATRSAKVMHIPPDKLTEQVLEILTENLTPRDLMKQVNRKFEKDEHKKLQSEVSRGLAGGDSKRLT